MAISLNVAKKTAWYIVHWPLFPSFNRPFLISLLMIFFVLSHCEMQYNAKRPPLPFAPHFSLRGATTLYMHSPSLSFAAKMTWNNYILTTWQKCISFESKIYFHNLNCISNEFGIHFTSALNEASDRLLKILISL